MEPFVRVDVVGRAQAELEKGRKDFLRVERDLEKSIIRSPIDGIVVRRYVEVGAAVADLQNGGTVIAELADDHLIHLLGEVRLASTFASKQLAERSTEIAVAKALGARDRVLVVQTMIESLIVSGSAALLGVGLGLAACAAFARLAPPDRFPGPIVSPAVVWVTLVAVSTVAIVAATIPCLRVRRMEVSAALRAV